MDAVGATLVVAQNDLVAAEKGRPQGHAPTRDQTIYWVAFEILKTLQNVANIELDAIINKE